MSKYSSLINVLQEAINQAKDGKGKERHADNEPFENQKICVINRWLRGSPVAGALFQAVKKTVESSRLPKDRAIIELLGAINYLSAAVILLRESEDTVTEEPKKINIVRAGASDKRYCSECLFRDLFSSEQPCSWCIEEPFEKPWFVCRA